MRLLIWITLAAGLAACSGSGAPPAAPAPRAARPAGTVPAITAADLQARMEIFAHDSMLGREAGTIGNVKGTDYIATELRRLGLDPAGENGTYFQTVTMVARGPDTMRVITVGDVTLRFRTDWIPVPSLGFFPFGTQGSIDGAAVIFGGRLGADLVDPAQAAGKVVLFLPPTPGGQPNFQFWGEGGNEVLTRYADARGIVIASLDISPPQIANILTQEQEDMAAGSVHASGGPLGILVTATAAQALLGMDPATASPGHAGRTVGGGPAFLEQPVPFPARNVVALLPGSDPVRRGTYVAMGVHNDHVGLVDTPVEHDSLRAYDRVIRPGGAENQPRRPTAEEQARIRQIVDSLRLTRPPRMDSVRNGADDDGSGSVTLLEMAEYFVSQPRRPARSLLFIWHTGEEKGLFGSQYFTEHPTVPRDSIVAELNMDMIGRGSVADIDGGGPGYMQMIGSRRLSTELGDLVETVNTEGSFGFAFDYQFDADGHPQNYYCRSDHYMYARFGIPIAFFTTGSHPDYHMLTDEAQYIDYAKMTRVGTFVAAIATRVANMDHRPVVDKPLPDPYGVCQQ